MKESIIYSSLKNSEGNRYDPFIMYGSIWVVFLSKIWSNRSDEIFLAKGNC